MEKQQLINFIKKQKSYLIVGLDIDLDKMPTSIKNQPDPIFNFAKGIIDATHKYCVGYKINTAFFESRNQTGWAELDQIIEYLNQNYPDHFTIADAKRGDIENTSQQYAKAFQKFDSITLSPYMGQDSIQPFLQNGKWAILLSLTSNPGHSDFQLLDCGGKKLFETVIEKSKSWGQNIMWVVGATRGQLIADARSAAGHDGFLLIPGVGAQGGNLEEVSRLGLTKDCGILVNSTRSIIYASKWEDWMETAQIEAKSLQSEMQIYLEKFLE